MKRTIPWGRVLMAVLAATALFIAVAVGRQWWRMRVRCDDAEATILAVIPDAFGANGTVEVDFSPKYDFTCKEMLVVEHNIPDRSKGKITDMVAGLRAQLAIVDITGKSVLEKDVTDDWTWTAWRTSEPGAYFPAFPFHPVPPGDYRLRITVAQPAMPLVGVPHRVVVRYELCGIERLATIFSGGIAFSAVIVGLALTTGIIAITRREKRHSNRLHAFDERRPRGTCGVGAMK